MPLEVPHPTVDDRKVTLNFERLRTWSDLTETDIAGLQAEDTAIVGANKILETVAGQATGIASITTTKTVFRPDGVPHSGGAVNITPVFFWFDPADHAISGRTTKLRLRAATMTNATSPAITVTAGLYPLSTPVGGAGIGGFTIGTVVTGSTAARALTASNSPDGTNSGSFDAPAAGWYALGVVGSGSQAANSWIGLRLVLQLQYV